MTDLEWERPMPDGAWVTVNNPGPGDVLTGLARRSVEGAEARALAEMEAVDA